MIVLENVRAGHRIENGLIEAVAGVTLTVGDCEALGIAGESGCGKSTLLRVLQGDFDGRLQMSGGTYRAEFPDAKTGQCRAYVAQDMPSLRGDRISFVPQGAMSALNPVVRVIDQVMDALPPTRRNASKRQIAAELGAFIERLDLPARTLQSYPHQLSGGMRQRMLIAMAAFAEPRVVFADEPTTALDVVVQRKILVLLRRLQREQANSLVIVSHDLGVHYQITDRIAILYAGKIVEIGPTERVLTQPRHPYTQALVEALPQVGDAQSRVGIEGRPPELTKPPSGCRFRTRCRFAFDRCAVEEPVLTGDAGGAAACHLHEEAIHG